MAGLNRVTLIGNLGQDPEITHANNGMAIAKFSVATSDARPDANGVVKTEWHRVVAFGKTAEYVQNYIKKGATVCVEGRIQYGKYENKDGVTVYTTDIVCNNFVNLTKREGSADGQYNQQNNNQNYNQQNNYNQDNSYTQSNPYNQSYNQANSQNNQNYNQAPSAPAAFNVGSDLTDDDLPF